MNKIITLIILIVLLLANLYSFGLSFSSFERWTIGSNVFLFTLAIIYTGKNK